MGRRRRRSDWSDDASRHHRVRTEWLTFYLVLIVVARVAQERKHHTPLRATLWNFL
jgi:hypothetical protein